MATTAVINWTAQSGVLTQELFYGKDAVVTGVPGSGTGWTAYTGNPMGPLVNTATISSLNDNVKYRFLVRSNCAANQSIFSEISGIKSICTTLVLGTPDTSGPGNVQYTLTVPSSISAAGSAVTGIKVTLEGKPAVSPAAPRTYSEVLYTPPFSTSYTDTLFGTSGFSSYTAYVTLMTGPGADVPLFECGPRTTFGTSGFSETIFIQNSTRNGSITDFRMPESTGFFVSTNYTPAVVIPGYTYRSFTNTLSPMVTSVNVTMAGILAGTTLVFRQIRNGVQLYASGFTYTGPNTVVVGPGVINVHPIDILEILDGDLVGFVPKQPLVTKVITPDNGYDVQVTLDYIQSGNTNYDVTFRVFSYSSGVSESYTRTVTVPSGTVESNIVHVTSTLNAPAFTDAVITATCVTPAASNVGVPYYYVSC